MLKTLLQHNQQLLSKNLAIIGKTGCGKTTLLQSLLDFYLQQGVRAIGIDKDVVGLGSDLGLWAEQRENGYRHPAANSLDNIPSSAAIVILELADGSASSNIKKQATIACNYVLSQSTNFPKTILCINEVEPLLRSPEIIGFLESLSKREDIQVILVSQLIDWFTKAMLKEFPVRLIGQIASVFEIQSIEETLLYPELVIRNCTLFASPKEHNCSSWLVDRGEGVPAKERFQFYQHYLK